MSTAQSPEIVVITGAAGGVGRAAAQEFARHGAHIGLIARGGAGQEGLEGARNDVEAAGGKGLVLPTDVADPDQVEAAADRVERELGPIDVWVNDAMVTVFAPFKDITPQEFRRVTEVTYLGQVYGTMAALRRMLPRDRGHIVQVGSALAYRSIPLQSAYCGAKAGIRGFTDSLRSELIHDGSHVKLTMVQMPALNTPQFNWGKNKMAQKAQPVPPIYQPEVAARAIYWAAHHDRRELYVGLSTLKAVIGNMIAPGLLDFYLARNGYKAQMRDEPADPDRPDNLFEPVAGDHGAHGAFDGKARSSSPELWVMEHSRELALAGAALAGLTCAALVQRGR
jgi:NAD(P)-dependent dehydrogenase (short-subunit alcohol dehydrogenase family)